LTVTLPTTAMHATLAAITRLPAGGSTPTPSPTPDPARSGGPGGGGLVGPVLRDPDAVWDHLAHATGDVVVAWWPVAVTTVFAVATAFFATRAVLRRRRLARLWQAARLITITPPPDVEASGGPALWGNLIGLLRPPVRRLLAGQPHLALEYRWDHTGAQIQMWVPGLIPPGLVERAIEAAWPGAHTSTRPATPPGAVGDDVLGNTGGGGPTATHQATLPGTLVGTGGTLRLARTEVLPLATGHDADPLRALFGAATGLAEPQQASVQILARPLAGRRIRQARRAMRRLRAAQSARPAGLLLDLITPGPSRSTRARTRPPADPERTGEIRDAVAKAAEPAWEVLTRYAVTTIAPAQPRRTARQTRAHRRAVVRPLRGRAHALASAFALYTGRNFLVRRRLRHPAAVIRARRLDRGDLLSVSELAALAHLPLDAATPGLARAGARAVAPPPGVPAPRPVHGSSPDASTGPGGGRPPVGTASSPSAARPASMGAATPAPQPSGAGVKVLGDSDTGSPRPVGLSVADARHHLHVIGATGSGKSTLMINLILADVAAGRGALVIDPKGDLVLDLLDRLPADVADRTVLIDPDDPAPPPCLNPIDLAHATGQGAGAGEVDTAVDNLVGIFRRIFAGFWGPRTDDVLRAAALTLLRAPSVTAADGDGDDPVVPTLADIPRLLDDAAFRHQLTAGIRDEVLAGFWTWYDQLPDGMRAGAAGPLLNKLRAFLLRSFVRDAVAAGPATLDLTRVLDGGLALVRLPKGVLGEETSRLLGSFVVARAWQAASARARAGTPRIDAGLYIDEAHNFLNLPYPIEEMLAEARGYRLSMVLAHQNLAQLPRELREGISANARNKIFFDASPDDARDLERHTLPTLARHDLSHLGAFQAATRLVVDSGQTPAFTMRTRPLPPPVPGRADHIRAAARTRTTPRASRGHAPRPRQPAPARVAALARRPDVRLQFLAPASDHPTAPTAPASDPPPAPPWTDQPLDGDT
jgi:hypothetical protein